MSSAFSDLKLMVTPKAGITLNSEDGKDSITFAAYMGGVRLGVFNTAREDRKPIVTVSMPSLLVFAFTKILKSLINAQPNTKKDIIIQSYDAVNKTYKPEITIVAVKDSRMLYSLELSNARLSPPIKFPLRGRKDFIVGGSDVTDETKSQDMLEWLIYKLEHQLEVERMISSCIIKEQPDFTKKGGNYNASNNTSNDTFF